VTHHSTVALLGNPDMSQYGIDTRKVNLWCALTSAEGMNSSVFAEIRMNSSVYLHMI
jgi:hypothetical protein